MRLFVIVNEENKIIATAQPNRIGAAARGDDDNGDAQPTFRIVPEHGQRLFEFEVAGDFINDITSDELDSTHFVDIADDKATLQRKGHDLSGSRDTGGRMSEETPQRRADRDEPPPIPEEPSDQEHDLPVIYGHNYPDVLRPIVFLPGIMGSTIDVKGQTEHLWPPIYTGGDGRLHLGSTSRLVNLPASSKEATGPFPLAYDALLKYLRRLRGVRNFHPFWYDWTQSNQTSGEQLAAFISEILQRPEYKRKFDSVDVVNHSMGGFVTRSAYLLSGAQAQIRRIAYIGSGHFGVPKAFFILRASYPLFETFLQQLIGWGAWKYIKQSDDQNSLEEHVKFFAQRLASMYELIPDRFYWPARTLVYDNHGFGTRYAITGMEATYYDPDWGFPQGLKRKVEDAMRFKTALGKEIPPSTSSERLLIYSDTEPTLDEIDYDNFVGDFDYDTPKASSERNGDGTVSMYSATGGMKGQSNVMWVRGTHSGLPEHTTTHLYIGRFLQKNPL